MNIKRRLTYTAAAVLYLITILFVLYLGINNFELENHVEQLQIEKDELQMDMIHLEMDLENITDAYWHLNNELERMEGETVFPRYFDGG